VAYQHALGLAGGAAGVHQPAADVACGAEQWRGGADDLLVDTDRGSRQGGRVADLHQGVHRRLARLRGGHPLGQRRVEDDGADLGVVKEVAHLVGLVPVVHVNRNGLELEDREDAFQVLDPVVEGDGHPGSGADPASGQESREPRRPVVQLPPGHAAVPVRHRRAIGADVRHGLKHRREILLHEHYHRGPPPAAQPARADDRSAI
jgi:hypothetical protein